MLSGGWSMKSLFGELDDKAKEMQKKQKEKRDKKIEETIKAKKKPDGPIF
jgi:hypothetical protein